MSTLLPLATNGLEGGVGFAANLQFQFVGIAIVLTALASLAVLMTLLGRVLAPRPVALTPGSAVAIGAAGVPGPAGVTPEVRAAISAAVHTTINGPHRIIEVAQSPDPRLSAWSVEGRRQIFHSHTVR